MSVPRSLTLAAEVTATRVTVASGELAALVATPAADVAARPAVLAVPGYTGSKEDFALLGPVLAAAGRRVLAIDLPGQHESPGSTDPLDYSVPLLARDVLGAVSAAGGGRPHLLGHSFGGLVCRAAVLANAGAVSSLTLLGSGPAALSGPRVERMVALEPLLDSGGLPAVYAAMEAMSATDPDRRTLPAEVAAFLERRFLSSTEAGLRGMGLAIRSEPDRVAELRTTGIPILVAHGASDDAWLPSVQRDMAERLGARYAEIAGSVHSPAAEAPTATAEVVLGFWADVEARVARRATS
jgi:pimeloyl-ACP methyl ester carboxylesterase